MEKQQILSIAIGSLLALGLAGNAHAADTKFEKGQCYSTYNLGYVVNQKIDKNHYGAVATYPQYVMTGFLHENAIITIARPLVEGGILNASVEYIGTVTRTLNNGFDVKVDLLKECTAEAEAERRKRQAPKVFVSQGGLTWMPVNDSRKNWPDANSYCTNTAINGQTGWRLPTKDELSALYNSGAMKNQGWTLDLTWSSTPNPTWSATPSNHAHYFVYLYNGIDDSASDFISCYVTCVEDAAAEGKQRREQVATEAKLRQEQVAAEAEAERKKRQAPIAFVSQGGLTWMPISDSGMTWSDANAYCTNTVINGQTGWRLPTKEELSSMDNSRAMDGQGVTLTHTWNSTATTLAWGTAPVSQPAYNNVTCVR